MGVITYLHCRVVCLGATRQREERGAAIVEYALLLVLIAVFCMIAVAFLGSQAANRFSKVGESVAAA